MEKANVLAALNDARDALDALISNEKTIEAVVAAAGLMADAVEGDGKVMSCGNGGSLCDAMHFAEEMTGRYRSNRRPYAALAISDASHMACVGNDYGYEEVFLPWMQKRFPPTPCRHTNRSSTVRCRALSSPTRRPSASRVTLKPVPVRMTSPRFSTTSAN